MRTIEYFYSAHSAYAYIGSATLMQICADHGCSLQHHPIALSPVVEAAGGLPFAKRTRPHIDYFFGREIERWAEWRDVPVIDHRPTHHDNPLDLPNGMLIAAAEQKADVDRLAHAILTAHWRDDADLADRQTLSAIAAEAGIDPAPLLDAAMNEEIQSIHANNTREAIERGVLGSPTYFVDGEMFYGQDRLEMLERALQKPFAPSRFRNP